ncbi:hypothetical protein DPMN_025171 [Dreissena polymorpha]|uniref:Uncharacterized protein n=1 Tax=Dreissena polymorpha TaxID=45954 RepID=A0A9D4LNU8_DREPO|nr:hypothetical protein DPMN_025171 [Dreissena polymorpha]
MKEGSNQPMTWTEYWDLIVVVDTTATDFLMQVVLLKSVIMHIQSCSQIVKGVVFVS